MTDTNLAGCAVPPGSIVEYRYVVYSESLALLKEKNPVRRANIARQLADWAATLAEMEAEEAKQFQAQVISSGEAA
jgi:hypothetical protein